MELLIRDSYLAFIRNSCKANSFRNFYVKNGRTKKDDLEDGNLSCAFFVSAVLLVFSLIKKAHLTVNGALKDMQENGWFEIKKLKPGAVLVWEIKKGKSGLHRHIGFFIDKNLAISNRSKLKKPGLHHLTFGIDKKSLPARKIEKIYWHNKLN